MSRIRICRRCVLGGVALSAALHLTIAAGLFQLKSPPLLDEPPPAPEHRLDVELAMFVESGAEPLTEPPEADAPQETALADPEPTVSEKAAPPPTQIASNAPLPKLAAAPTPPVEPKKTEPARTPERKKKTHARHEPPPRVKPAPKPAKTRHAKPRPTPKPARQAPKRVSKSVKSSDPPTRSTTQTQPPKRTQAEFNRSSAARGRTAASHPSQASTRRSATPSRASGANRASDERAYLAALQRAIGRKQQYPMSARRKNEAGTTIVAFIIQGDGRFSGIRIAKSSGHSGLDQAAVQAMYRLARFKPIPKSLGRASWALRVPIRFHLK